MTSQGLKRVTSIICFCLLASGFAWANMPQSYGDAVVSAVLALDENVTFFCDIQDFPPVVGTNMPVRLKSLKPAQTAKENQQLLMFLQNLLFAKDKPARSVTLKGIQRGPSFCLMADMLVDGKDLCDLLVEQNLARKVVEVGKTQSHDAAGENPSSDSGTTEQTQEVQYVCSKSSKVFHKSTCPHVKRMDMSKAITFTNREQAAASGRRPCKTCNP